MKVHGLFFCLAQEWPTQVLESHRACWFMLFKLKQMITPLTLLTGFLGSKAVVLGSATVKASDFGLMQWPTEDRIEIRVWPVHEGAAKLGPATPRVRERDSAGKIAVCQTSLDALD